MAADDVRRLSDEHEIVPADGAHAAVHRFELEETGFAQSGGERRMA